MIGGDGRRWHGDWVNGRCGGLGWTGTRVQGSWKIAASIGRFDLLSLRRSETEREKERKGHAGKKKGTDRWVPATV